MQLRLSYHLILLVCNETTHESVEVAAGVACTTRLELPVSGQVRRSSYHRTNRYETHRALLLLSAPKTGHKARCRVANRTTASTNGYSVSESQHSLGTANQSTRQQIDVQRRSACGFYQSTGPVYKCVHFAMAHQDPPPSFPNTPLRLGAVPPSPTSS